MKYTIVYFQSLSHVQFKWKKWYKIENIFKSFWSGHFDQPSKNPNIVIIAPNW